MKVWNPGTARVFPIHKQRWKRLCAGHTTRQLPISLIISYIQKTFASLLGPPMHTNGV